MKKYRTLEVVKFGMGVLLELEKDQAEPRSTGLVDKGKGTFEVIRRVEFKAGEVVGLDTPPKVLLGRLEEVASKPVKKAAR